MSEQQPEPASLVPMVSMGSLLRAEGELTRYAPSDQDAPPITSLPQALELAWRAIRHWWKVALPCAVVLSIVAGALVWTFFVPRFRATAWLKIASSQDYIAFPQAQGAPDHFVRTQLELIKSPLVMEQVCSQPEIAGLPELQMQSSPVEWLGSQIAVRSVGNSDLFQITFDGMQPDHAARIVNAVMDVYLKLQSNELSAQTQKIIQLLEQERQRKANELERLKSNIRSLAKQATGRDPVFTGNAQDVVVLTNPLNALEDQLAAAEVDRQYLEAELAAAREALAQSEIKVPEDLLDKAFEQDAQVIRSREILDLQRAKVSGAAAVSRQPDEDPRVKKLEHEATQMEQRLADLRTELRPRLEAELTRLLTQQRQEEIDALQTDLERQKIREKLLTERFAQKRKELEKLGGESLNLAFAKDDLRRAEDVYQRISDRAEALRTERRAPDRVSSLKRAVPPHAPVRSIPYERLGAACLGCFCLPFLLALIWERRLRRVAGAQQLFEEARLPIVGETTLLPGRPVSTHRRLSRQFERSLDTFVESIDYVRTRLLMSQEWKDLQVLVVASAVSREGKTKLASHLAVSLSRAQPELTLLIDADLRDPDLHEMFEIPLEPGLADVLASEGRADLGLVTQWSKNLHVLTAGRLLHSPHRLLSSEALPELLKQARKIYRYIIIDAPPVLPVSDTLSIAHHADGTLLSTMRDRSRGPQVRLAAERLQAAGARLIGAVLNGVPAREYGYGYGNYVSSRSFPGSELGEDPV